jgi:hypothetical protein
MASEDQVARRQLQEGEDIVFIQRGGVMTAMMDPQTGQPFPIDEFGTGKGWLAATTDNRVVYGYFGSFGGAKLGGQFGFTSWQDDPRGVAFMNEGIGPEDVCIFIPKTIAPAALHGQLSKILGNDSQIEELQALYANRVAFGAQLSTEFQEINRVYGMLRDLEADADQAMVDQQKAEHAGYMASNPFMEYYEPHLDPEEFDSRRKNF